MFSFKNTATYPFQGSINIKIMDETMNSHPKLANPATINCLKYGAKWKMVTDSEGNQKGICIFPNGTQIDEWKFFRLSQKKGNLLNKN